MNINTLIDNLVTDIVSGYSINTWTMSNYSKMVNVYSGVDQRKPPDEISYPIIHIFPLSKNVGYSLEEKRHVIGITCGIYDETSTTTSVSVSGLGNAVKTVYQGIANIESFRKLVETAAISVDCDNMFTDISIDYETIEAFPYFFANMELTFYKDYCQGDNIFT